MELLEQEYQRLYPEYRQLMAEYSKTHQQAHITRSVSSLFSKRDWCPPGRVLSALENEMLCGLPSVAVLKNRGLVKEPRTGRTIEYTTNSSERGT